MKKILTILLLLAVTTFAFADNSSDARKLLDKAVAKANINKGATANFSISSPKMGTRTGSITIKGNKFVAKTPGAIMWYNGKTQWVYNTKSDEVNVSNPNPSQQQSMNPYTFLSLYKQGYTMSLTNAASGKEVHLVGKGKAISEMYILIDKNNTIKQVKMLQKGQWMTINISNFKSVAVGDNIFTFNQKDYPKAEIIDLR